MARQLRGSLLRLMELPDHTLVLPAHGAGSACGKALSSETVSTIGTQRATNYALRPMSEDDFVRLVTEGQPAAPGYFGHDARLNRQAHALLDEHEPPKALSLDEVDRALAGGAVLLDTRAPEDFAGGHLAGSLNVSLGGRFSEQVGSIVPAGTPIVLVSDVGTELEAKVRLGRIGFDDVVGHLEAPLRTMSQHPERTARLSRLTAGGLRHRQAELGDRLQLVDVRNPAEVTAQPVEGARNVPLARLRDEMGSLDPHRPTVLLCAGGARSAVANSLLRSAGFTDVSDVLGGAAAILAEPVGVGTERTA